jgi:hypothetical protein
MTKTAMIKGEVRTVTLSKSQYSSLEPQIDVRFAKGGNRRQFRAVLHQLAAAVELATPSDEYWLVQMEWLGDEHGRVYLELFQETKEEAARGLDVLRGIVG